MRSESTGAISTRVRAAFGIACLGVAFAATSFAQDGEAEREQPPADEAKSDGGTRIKEIDMQEGEPIVVEACFNTSAVRNFDALDDKHIYLRAGRDEHFLLTMLHSCSGLRSAFEMGIAEQFGRVCSNTLSSVIYSSFGRAERCSIGRVEAVDSKELAIALVERRDKRDD